MSFHLVALIGANALVLGFGSGLLFFVVGLVVGLLARHYRTSRLAVAQVFPLLSTFGVAYGAARWGGVFMPVQGLSPLGGAVLLWVELLLDTVAFAGLAGVSLQLMGLRVRWAALWLGAAVAAGLWWGQPGLAAALRLVLVCLPPFWGHGGSVIAATGRWPGPGWVWRSRWVWKLWQPPPGVWPWRGGWSG